MTEQELRAIASKKPPLTDEEMSDDISDSDIDEMCESAWRGTQYLLANNTDCTLQSKTNMSTYRLHPLELAEYTRIQPKHSGIEICMYIDESSSFKRWNHPLWVIISAGDPYVDTWIGLSISDKPTIINCSNDNGISTDIINRCKDFVARFHQLLTAIAVETIDSSIIYEILSKHDWQTLTSQDILNLSSELTEFQDINDWMTLEEFGDYLKEEIRKIYGTK